MRVLLVLLLGLLAAPAAARANEPPACADDHYVNVAGVAFAAGCSDPDGDALTYEIVTPPAHGTLVQRAPGDFAYDPAQGFHGDDTMAYLARDPAGAVSAPATVTITTKWVKPECSPFPGPPTVTAGLSGTMAFCWGERLEIVTPPQHGTVTFRASGDTWLPIYNADIATTATSDTFGVRAVTPDAASGEYRFAVAITPAAPAPAPVVLPLAAAPVIQARATSRRHRAVKRAGLPLALGCDLGCRMAVTVTRGGKLAGSRADLPSGAVAIPLKGRLRRGTRLVVTVDATAAAHAPSRLRFRVTLR